MTTTAIATDYESMYGTEEVVVAHPITSIQLYLLIVEKDAAFRVLLLYILLIDNAFKIHDKFLE